MRRGLTVLFAMGFAWGGPVAAAELSVGVAPVDITPPAGWRMSGYFHERINTGTHDPLYAKAMVFSDGATRAALVFCDLIGVPREVAHKARALAAERTGIPSDHIMVAGTHSHTGPLYFGLVRDRLHARAVKAHEKDPCEPIDYVAALTENIARAVEQAHAALRPVRIETGTVEPKPQLAFNRRFHMRDGSVRFNPGQNNPDIIRPAGPIDPEAGILLVRDTNGGTPLACLTVFALHLDTTGGTQYSADYPYYLEKGLRASLGEGLVSLFGIGTCGDVNHIDVTTTGRRQSEEIGTLLANAVGDAVPRLRSVAPAPLAVRHATVDAPLQEFTTEQAQEAAEVFEQFGSGEVPFLRMVEACRTLDLQARGVRSIPLEVQAFRLGSDVAVVALPGEIFVELGLAIKQASPFRTTLVVELANDYPSYIPTRKAFAEGSYEIVNSRVQPGAGERLVETATALLKALAP